MISSIFAFFKTLLGYNQAAAEGISTNTIVFCEEDKSLHTHDTAFYCGTQKLGTAAYQPTSSFSAAGHTHPYLPTSGGTVTDTIISAVKTNTHLAGNQGRTIINSSASAGSYVMLAKMNSTNGFFMHGTFGTGYLLQYTAASVVSEGNNYVSYRATLLDENGNTSFPGTVTAPTFSGKLSGNASTASKWATARTLTIGNTGKSVNGSANVAWSLSEIGAAQVNHTHDYAPTNHTHPYLPLSGGAITGNLGVQGDLNVLGDATFNEGTLYAQSIVGNLDGTASKALGDGQGQQINTTYIKDIDVRGLPFIITKGDGSTYSQKAGYLYENTGKKDWVHLGTFNTNIQGDGGEIWLFGGAGQNGNPSQHMWAHLFIKQGYQATASTKERYAATYEIFCKKDDANYWYFYANMKFKVLCKEIGKVDVWAYFGHDCSRCYYYPAGRYDSFVPSNELLSSEPTDESIYGVEQPISGGFVIPSKIGYSVDDMLPLTGGTVTGNLGVSGTLYTDKIKGATNNSVLLGSGTNAGFIAISDDLVGNSIPTNAGSNWCIEFGGDAFFSSVSQSSDQRLKDNIHDVDTAFTEKYWNTPSGLIHEYDWKKSGRHATGMIAQELLGYIPEAVNHKEEEDTYTVDYTSATCKILGAMFKKIKQLEATLQSLEAKNSEI